MTEKTGLYFIANDVVYDLTVAFLNSVRTFEPFLPLCFIPYNDDVGKIVSLGDRYQFTVWTDDSALKRCDALSRRFHGRVSGHYRKLVIWGGPFERFAYIDVDTILLTNLDTPLAILDTYDILAATSNNPAIRHFVWKQTMPAKPAILDSEYAANTGFLLSKREMLSTEYILHATDSAGRYLNYMELECAEQPLLNYLIVKSGRRYSSLSRIARESGRRDIPLQIWSGSFDDDLLSRAVPPLLVHWAGQWQHGAHIKSLVWNYFRHLGENRQ